MKQKEWTHLHIFLIIHFTIIPGSVNCSEELKEYFTFVIPTAADYATGKSVSIKCAEDSRLLLTALLNQEEWALSSIRLS